MANGPRKRPIFPGSNDEAYQILATWAQSLRSPKNAREAARAQRGRPEPEDGETFAAGRGRTAKEGPKTACRRFPVAAARRCAGTALRRVPEYPRRRLLFPAVAASGPTVDRQEAADDFPLPFAITGKKPNLASRIGRKDEDGRRKTEDGRRRTETEDRSSSVAAGKTAEAPTANPARMA